MPCEDRQLTEADRVGGQQQNPGIQRGIRPFSGQATPENLVDYLNREVYPVLKQARDAVNDIYRAVADNASSANPLGFLFSELTTGGDPTTGLVKFDNADVTAATVLRVSQTNAKRVDVGPWLEVMAGGATTPLGTVTLYHASDPGRFARFDLDSMTDIGAYWELGITPLEASGAVPWVDGDRVSLAFIPGVASGGVTVPGGVVTSTWADVLGNGNTSGANNPTISAGQRLIVPGGQSLGDGDVHSEADLAIDAVTNLHLHAGGEIHVGHSGGASLVHIEADTETDMVSGGDMLLQASTTVDLQSGTDLTATAVSGNVQLNASGFYRVITGGVERLEIEATGGWQVGGTVGSSGQVLKSNGAGTPPTWQADTDTTYTAGDGIDLVGTTFSADVSDFAGNGLEDDGANNLRLSAISGAIGIAAGGGASTFTGFINPAGAVQSATSFLRWLNTGNVTFTLAVNGTIQEVSASVDLSGVTYTAGDGIDLAGNQFSADVSDFAGSGLEDDGANNLRIAAAAAGAGLTGGGGSALAVGAGTGITVNANDVAVATASGFAWTGVHSFTATTFTVNVSGDASITAGDDLSLVVTDQLLLDADGGVLVTGNGVVQIGAGATDGFLVMEGATASTPTVSSGDGMFWSEDPSGGTATEPRFTGDDNVDHRLQRVGPNTVLTIAGTVNNAAVTPATTCLRCSSTTTLNGIAAGYQGQALDVFTVSDVTLTCNHASGSATGAVLALPNNAQYARARGGMRLVFSDNAWRCVATADNTTPV